MHETRRGSTRIKPNRNGSASRIAILAAGLGTADLLSSACVPEHGATDPAPEGYTESAITTCSPFLEQYPVRGPHNGGWDRNATSFTCPAHPSYAPDNSDYYTGYGGPGHANGHLGNDLFGPRGAAIVAARSGVIDSASNDSVGGLNVVVRDGCGWYYYYAHLDAVDWTHVGTGRPIAAGTSIGALGDTGSARGTQPHLHFSVFPGNYYAGIDPFPLLQAVDMTACEGPPSCASGAQAFCETPSDPPPITAEASTCGDWAREQGYAWAWCEWNGNGACGGMGPRTIDCDHCCDVGTALGLSCGDWAALNGIENAACEWNGNQACGGSGAPTDDCDHCCAW